MIPKSALSRPWQIVLISVIVPLGVLCTARAQRQDDFQRERDRMVRAQIASGLLGRTPVKDERVLEVLRTVPRHEFVPENVRDEAYSDTPLPIGSGQTISQPYIVAIMTEALKLGPDDKVLEVGTGSGYQAAVLAELVKEVYSIEIVQELGERAADTLERLDYANVEVRIGDGYRGWPEHAPFDAIIVTAAPDHIPQPLIDQLRPGGRMVIPVGGRDKVQQLTLIEKNEDGEVTHATLDLVRFVPLTGEAERKKE